MRYPLNYSPSVHYPLNHFSVSNILRQCIIRPSILRQCIIRSTTFPSQISSVNVLSAHLSSVSELSAQLLFRTNHAPSVQQAYPLIQFRTHVPSSRPAPSDPTYNEAAPQADGRYQVGCGCELNSVESFIRVQNPAPLTRQVTVSVHSVTDTDDTGNQFKGHFIPDAAMGGGGGRFGESRAAPCIDPDMTSPRLMNDPVLGLQANPLYSLMKFKLLTGSTKFQRM